MSRDIRFPGMCLGLGQRPADMPRIEKEFLFSERLFLPAKVSNRVVEATLIKGEPAMRCRSARRRFRTAMGG